MSELISQLGIDWRLLLAQAVNFLLLLWVLKRYAFGPLQRFLAKRSHDIEVGLENAQKAAEEREELKEVRNRISLKAQREAETILQEARQKGAKEHDEIMKRAEEKVRVLVDKTRAELVNEKEKMMQEARRDLAGLAMMAASKLLERKVDEPTDREIVERALREIK